MEARRLGPVALRLEVDLTDQMTDIGTSSYTIIAQTAAEMLGVPFA